MIDLVIRGMDMPKYTTKAEFGIDADGNALCMVYHEDGTEPDIYNVIPLPEGHGKMGDLDKIVSFIDYYERPTDRNESPFKALNAVRDYICNVSNTIVPAEGEEH